MTLRRVSRERNQTGSAPPSALGSSKIIGELLDGVGQPARRVQVEFLVVGSVACGNPADVAPLSSKLRPPNETENVFRRDVEAAAA